jgi:hypothetical protein
MQKGITGTLFIIAGVICLTIIFLVIFGLIPNSSFLLKIAYLIGGTSMLALAYLQWKKGRRPS